MRLIFHFNLKVISGSTEFTSQSVMSKFEFLSALIDKVNHIFRTCIIIAVHCFRYYITTLNTASMYNLILVSLILFW